MAEVHVERKRGGLGWLWALLALLVIALLAWFLWPQIAGTAERAAEEPAATMPAEPPPAATATSGTAAAPGEASVAAVLADPRGWTGREFAATVIAVESPTQGAWWVEQNGQRMLALLPRSGGEDPPQPTPGQPVALRGTVRDAAYLSELPRGSVPADAQNLARQQPAYLVVDPSPAASSEPVAPDAGP